MEPEKQHIHHPEMELRLSMDHISNGNSAGDRPEEVLNTSARLTLFRTIPLTENLAIWFQLRRKAQKA